MCILFLVQSVEFIFSVYISMMMDCVFVRIWLSCLVFFSAYQRQGQIHEHLFDSPTMISIQAYWKPCILNLSISEKAFS